MVLCSDSYIVGFGDVVAFQEQVRIAEEEGKSKLSSALLKAQMTVEAKRQQRKEAKDKALLEVYMDDRAITALECLDMANYLIGNAVVNYLELVEAAAEYDERYGGEAE